MITYCVEFFLLHSLFFLVYKIFLSQETQLQFLRGFLLGSTILALTIPLIDIPSYGSLPTFTMDSMVITAQETLVPSSTFIALPWYAWLFLGVSLLFLLKVTLGLVKIGRWYVASVPDVSYDLPVRRIKGIENSFTFFRWVFIDLDHFENPTEIIKHEWGHSRMLHSIDVLFFNLLSILFWWVPSLWFSIRELKKVHEFEADQYALQHVDQGDYIKILVHSTLKANGLNLASSFHDAPIVKRLNFIKKMKKKISPWKAGSIMAIVLISGAMFACDEELKNEVAEIVEESNQQFLHTDEVEAALKAAQAKYPNEEFTVVETIIENKESILKLEDYDPTMIESIMVTKDEDEQKVVMIVSKNSKLFEKATNVPIVEENAFVEHIDGDGNEVFVITEEAPIYPGGKEGLRDFLQSTMKYPAQAQRLGVEGRVYVQFVVEKDGSITDPQVVKGIGAGCNSEALRVIKSMPKWTAGKQRGNAVRSKMVLPITFALN